MTEPGSFKIPETQRGFAHDKGRDVKARKIEALLGGALEGLDILDLGAGSGFLSTYFRGRGGRVTAADRDISNFRVDGLSPVLIGGTELPFADASFDLVVFNHVIEHVGDKWAQDRVMTEIARILRPDGRLYLAVPNKWALIEPHYRIPLLGALPRPLANAVVRKFRNHPVYDCFPLNRRELLRLAARHFHKVEDVSIEAFAWFASNELESAAGRILRRLPGFVIRALRPAFPTLMAVASMPKPGGGAAG